MLKGIVWGVGGLVVVAVGLFVALMLTLRTKYPPLLTLIRRMNRSFGNPKVMETAGKAGADRAVICHVGRSSGKSYRTPIGVVPTTDGFMITLPYGNSADWFKNVMAAGSAVVVNDGIKYEVVDPRVVTAAEADPYFSPADRRIHRLFGVDQFLRLRVVDSDVAVGDNR